MATRMRCLHSLAKTPVHRTQCLQKRIRCRYYSSDTFEDSGNSELTPQSAEPEDAAWFQTLREEMLNRELPLERDSIEDQTERKLGSTLHSFFPNGWQASPTIERQRTPGAVMPSAIGEHLIFCNPALSDDKLLPDGTDQLHSPGGSFVRRMWAGGAVRINKNLYFDANTGWALYKDILCFERIKDVRLRGQGDKEKIFITIERKFARYDPVFQATKDSRDKPRQGASLAVVLNEKMRNWDQAFLTEDRNIVFMRERSPEELQDIQAGKMAPVKYLQSLGQPDFSHTLIPTNTLLARFSALTFNAHLIHLDREYARNVEGHRNLLVHGPLTQTLMLKFIGTHLQLLPDGPQIVEAIEYRNLAPLYCGEELRLCAREKVGARMDDARMYDIWIEGPTGGMAVKGLVRTARPPNGGEASSPRATPTASNQATVKSDLRQLMATPLGKTTTENNPRRTKSKQSNGTALYFRRNFRTVAVKLDSDTTDRERPTHSARNDVVSTRQRKSTQYNGATPRKAITDSNASSQSPDHLEHPPTSPANRPSLRKYLRAHRLQFMQRHRNYNLHELRQWIRQVREHYLNPTDSLDPGPLMRAVHVPAPMRSRMKLADRNILQRTMRALPPQPRIAPVPVVRYYEHNDGPSRFASRGVRRLIARPAVRIVATAETMMSFEAKRRARRRAAMATRRE